MTPSIVVTGGAGGIGRAVVLAAANLGWGVAALDLRHADAVAVAAEALAAGACKASGIGCDVTDEDSVADALEQAWTELDGFDGVLANAGIELNSPVQEMERATWDRVLAVNLTGVFHTTKHSIRAMIAAKRPGSIVCTSSPAAFVGFAGGGNAAYGASKGGVSAFVRAAALDAAPAGIRVNGLVPGATDTPMLLAGVPAEQHARLSQQIARQAHDQIPLGRLARPEEIAAGALWLLSDDSSYVTGTNLVCDGGLLAKSANTF